MICVVVSLLVAYYLLVGLLKGLRIAIFCLLLGLHDVLRLGLLVGLLVSLLVVFLIGLLMGLLLGLLVGVLVGLLFGCFLAAFWLRIALLRGLLVGLLVSLCIVFFVVDLWVCFLVAFWFGSWLMRLLCHCYITHRSHRVLRICHQIAALSANIYIYIYGPVFRVATPPPKKIHKMALLTSNPNNQTAYNKISKIHRKQDKNHQATQKPEQPPTKYLIKA